MTIDNVLEILEKHKLHIPSNVFYELKADIVNFEEPTTKNDLEIVMDAMEYKTNSLIENIKSEILHFANAHCSGDDINIYDMFKVIDDCCEPSNSTTKNDLGVDLISRADAIKAMQDKAKELKNEDTINGLCGAVAILFDMPSVTPQEPRIITCKECKYYRNKGNKYSYCTKRLNVDSVTNRYREPNFYCADAVLREVDE